MSTRLGSGDHRFSPRVCEPYLASRRILSAVLLFLTLPMIMAQTSQHPNLEAERAAMRKLSFLLGEWSGGASIAPAPGQVIELSQSEVVQFKLDGLVLMIEGVGRTKLDNQPKLQALGLITFDDAAGTYRMRAFNDGRWLETAVRLLDEGKGLTWGFSLGEISTKTILRMNEKGEWTEHTEVTVRGDAPRPLIELVVRPTGLSAPADRRR